MCSKANLVATVRYNYSLKMRPDRKLSTEGVGKKTSFLFNRSRGPDSLAPFRKSPRQSQCKSYEMGPTKKCAVQWRYS
jgi:hypothetical protein